MEARREDMLHILESRRRLGEIAILEYHALEPTVTTTTRIAFNLDIDD
ncbi:hypothetical protein GCM10012279_08680 [Micromonospora yangpuensis]|nr:hypothetical protein GCM10012279_08680 [Micromonospora yangpuensis]